MLAPEGHSSAGMIKRVLTDLGIPVFMDETRPIMHSSAAELISALLDLSCGEYKTRDMLRFIKTGILGVPEDTVFRFEKYARSFHIKGKRFLKPLKYSDKNTEALLPELEMIRKRAAAAVEPLVDALALAKGLDKIVVPYENAKGMRHTREVIAGLKELCGGKESAAESSGYGGKESAADSSGYGSKESGERKKPGSVGIFIGPEGGFEEKEILQLQEIGAEIITLGHRILRTDTAGIAVLSMLMLHLEED